MPQTHFIEKQKLDFEFTSEEKAKDWNKKTATFYDQEIVPILEQLFNKHIPADRWYSIFTLKIDLGEIYSHDLRAVLIRKIEAELIRCLNKNNLSNNFVADVHDAVTSAKEIDVKTSIQKLLETFYTFLEYGILVWNSQIKTIEALEKEIRQCISLVDLAKLPAFRHRINLRFVRERLYFQFTEAFRNEIFRIVFSKELKFLEVFKQFILGNLETSSLDAVSKKQIRKIVSGDLMTWIVSVGSDSQEDWPEAIIFSLFEKMAKGKSEKDQIVEFIKSLYHSDESEVKFGPEAETIRLIRRHASAFTASLFPTKGDLTSSESLSKVSPSENQTTAPDLRSASESYEKESFYKDPLKAPSVAAPASPDEKGQKDIVADVDKSVTAADNLAQFSDKQNVKSSPEDIQSPEKKELRESKFDSDVEPIQDIRQIENRTSAPSVDKVPAALGEYYVLNAGLVLCWPYLNQLFKRTGYLRDGKFKDQNRQQRAVLLLGYLAGFEECEEHELTLAKLLTNWPLSMPVIKRMKLTLKEKKEANAMLTNMILNWPILKNTSIDGLQSSFFHRAGKLRKEEQGWKLIVEQKSYDMLLDHLPYSIAIIKLPWMEEILKVDWA
jgi:hypothetical protein